MDSNWPDTMGSIPGHHGSKGVSSGSSGSQFSSCQDMGVMADPCDPLHHPLRGSLSKNWKRNRKTERWRPSDTAGRTVEQGSNCENSLAVPLKVRHRFPIRSSSSTLVIYLGEKKTTTTVIWKDTCTSMFTAHYLQLPGYNLPKCLPTVTELRRCNIIKWILALK